MPVFFIGLYLNTDPHHNKCLLLAEKVTEDIVTSYDVIDEVATTLPYFGRKDNNPDFFASSGKNYIKRIFLKSFPVRAKN